MNQEVQVFRSPSGLVVASMSLVPRRGYFMDGWTRGLPRDDSSPQAVGDAVLDGLAHNGTITVDELPALGGTGATVASLALGYETEDAMLADGASHVHLFIKRGTWHVTPMVNEGPGKGWSGHEDAPAVVREAEDWVAEDLGATVLAALDAAERLSRV